MDASIEVTGPTSSSLRRPSVCNSHGRLDSSDGICLLGFLFQGSPDRLPCEHGAVSDPGNLTLLDCSILDGSATAVTGGPETRLERCTLSGNGLGVALGEDVEGGPYLTSCIVWDNVGGSIAARDDAAPTVRYSCVEGKRLWPGEGNTSADPLFEAWGEASEVRVRTQAELGDALSGFSFALSRGSPCRGTGEGGVDMGADAGSCEGPGSPRRTILLDRAVYSIRGLSLVHRVSIEGPRTDDLAELQGTVVGLRTGCRLAGVKVSRGGDDYSRGAIQGGIRVGPDEAPEIVDCEIVGNAEREAGGGGVTCAEGSAPVLRRCVISGNYGTGAGGLYCARGSSPRLSDCLVTGNKGRESGGVMCEGSSRAVLFHSTISANVSEKRGGGLMCRGASPMLVSSIVWGNLAEEDPSVAVEAGSSPLLVHCCVEGGSEWPGDGNIRGDPIFLRPGRFDYSAWKQNVPAFVVDAGDYRLERGSPCIDSGECIGISAEDIEGVPRPQGAGCDMGAYERDRAAYVEFVRGDTNADGSIDLADPVALLGYLFLGTGGEPSCVKSADADDSGGLSLTDAIHVLVYLFLGGPEPAAPFPACGVDPTRDRLPCAAHGPCGSARLDQGPDGDRP